MLYSGFLPSNVQTFYIQKFSCISFRSRVIYFCKIRSFCFLPIEFLKAIPITFLAMCWGCEAVHVAGRSSHWLVCKVPRAWDARFCNVVERDWCISGGAGDPLAVPSCWIVFAKHCVFLINPLLLQAMQTPF